ncbi:acyl carrier protein [Streptomyces sp. PTM05]|uniref:Acyl carrier protein n=1 Tax=Streptantibioticus parmotrematis TaxID=2873249 RepID=A0ABS7QWD4_9ACTN|nr:acyl carrier protein [Streptantibioticus parmotrematis]MBY8886097.1 acyl carrier protein [Streptantibioticus parmotrematis]
MSDINDLLKEALTDSLGVPSESITPEATFEDLELDSLALAELAVICEERTGHPVGDDNINIGSSLGEVSAFLDTITTPHKDSA